MVRILNHVLGITRLWVSQIFADFRISSTRCQSSYCTGGMSTLGFCIFFFLKSIG